MTEIIHTQEYDRWSFDPPMPVLDIDLSRPGTQTGATPILGRDVLNQLHIALMGIAGVTEVFL